MQPLPDGPPPGAFPVDFLQGGAYQGNPIVAAWIEPFRLQSGMGGAALMIRTAQDLDIAGTLEWKGASMRSLRPEARETVEALGAKVGVPGLGAAVVVESELPRNLRRRGLGLKMYGAAALSAASDQRALLSAEFAQKKGSTNPTARKLWGQLTKTLMAWPGRAAVLHVAGLPATSRDLWAHAYVSPRQRDLTWNETMVRNVAWKMKKARPNRAHTRAAQAMGVAVRRAGYRAPILVPVPSSSGDTTANRIVAEIMVQSMGGGVVLDALERPKAVESSSSRRQAGKRGLKAKDHKFVWKGPEVDFGNLLFVDNVTTTGATLAAARRCVGGGRGICWAKADEVLSSAAR